MTTATQQAPATNAAPNTKKPGKAYDLCRVEVAEDGKKTFHNMGTLFIRENQSGGVVYLRNGVDAEGKKLPDTELAVFAKKPRS